MGRAEEAVIGTKSARPREIKKSFVGPDVPPLSKIDLAHACDPIGRAWIGHLLDGFPREAVDIRDAARRFAGLYWSKLPSPNPVSSLYRNMVSGLVEELPSGISRERMLEDADERDARQEDFLLKTLRTLDRKGIDTRRAFDAIVLDPFSDNGPAWLDALLHRRGGDHEREKLRLAVFAIIDVLL